MYDMKLIAPGPPGIVDDKQRNALEGHGVRFMGGIPVESEDMNPHTITSEGWTYQLHGGLLRVAYQDTIQLHLAKSRIYLGVFEHDRWSNPKDMGFRGIVPRAVKSAAQRLSEWLRTYENDCDLIVYWYRGSDMTLAYRLTELVHASLGEEDMPPKEAPVVTGAEPVTVPVEPNGTETEEPLSEPVDDRRERILEAMKTYDGKLTGDGEPYMSSLRVHADMEDITTEERDELWPLVNDES